MGNDVHIPVRHDHKHPEIKPPLEKDFTYGYDKKRDLFHELAMYPDARPIAGIIGLRRTGKMVLLEQLIDFLMALSKNPVIVKLSRLSSNVLVSVASNQKP